MGGKSWGGPPDNRVGLSGGPGKERYGVAGVVASDATSLGDTSDVGLALGESDGVGVSLGTSVVGTSLGVSLGTSVVGTSLGVSLGVGVGVGVGVYFLHQSTAAIGLFAMNWSTPVATT